MIPSEAAFRNAPELGLRRLAVLRISQKAPIIAESITVATMRLHTGAAGIRKGGVDRVSTVIALCSSWS